MVIDCTADRNLSNASTHLQLNDLNKVNQNQQTFQPPANQIVQYNQANYQPNQAHFNELDQKMNAFNEKSNLVQNNLLKDSNQSINLHQQDESLDDSEDENDDILEISPCGRWSKRRDQVKFHFLFYEFLFYGFLFYGFCFVDFVHQIKATSSNRLILVFYISIRLNNMTYRIWIVRFSQLMAKRVLKSFGMRSESQNVKIYKQTNRVCTRCSIDLYS